MDWDQDQISAHVIEQVGADADDRVDDVGFDQLAADLAFGSAAEQDAVGHDGGDDAVGRQHGEHVLEEHEVGLLAALGGVAAANLETEAFGWRLGDDIDHPTQRAGAVDHGTSPPDHLDPFHIEWMRFEAESPMPDLVQRVPHVAFEVADLAAALEGLQLSLNADPQNADLLAAEKSYADGHARDLQQLHAISELLGQLELDNADYKALLLEQGRSRGLDDGERSAILAEVNKLWERLSNVSTARQVARTG